MPMLVSAVSLAAMLPVTSHAQARGEAPLAPASSIGPTTASPTISVLGMASSSNGGGTPLAQRGEVWLGATQPLGRLGNVRFNAIGHADIHTSDGVSTNNAGEGMLALRARARFSGAQVWSAFSYGYVKSDGQFAPPNVNLGPAVGTGFDGTPVDTTVSQYVDVGSIQRAEAGVISNLSGVEFSFGLALDRISRVTERTLTFEESSFTPPTAMSATGRTTVQRSLQRREIATGIASMGFYTGPATWLISVTSPLATRITSDASAPKARIAPTIASVAIMQPVTGWLSIVGAAATNSSSVGSTAFRDDMGAGRHGSWAPVVALGVRLARLPFFGRGDDTPSGILSFESRVIGTVDSASVNQVDDSTSAHGALRDTLRVVLWIDAPKAESVELMGDATQWTVTAMSRSRSGRWRAELKLAPGVHRITVRADGGKWIAPPSLPIGNDDYGTPVGMIIVRGDR
jgi:hypothetical protein